MSRQQVIQHYTRLLTRWPVDRLRPEDRHLQHLLRKRIEVTPTSHVDEGREINAAYLLLDNTFTKQYPLPDAMMNPSSNPTHYTDLARELDEAPDRSWWGSLVKRVQGMVRFR
ncbi:hypothetical protein BAUCODRAFT_145542 [Baudoinia panamericana UAMH 10762]|uniref:Uncharacterized protein n=1 Tax=Baudoinia panamericana (strain UAMH 10762) TaxID=717646 RepID=M2N806_BAUPA|nr:uncharacterized protein BAUCODRAFT_145542 [Baudoinia panamericana UAMH 10762]EMD00249.1 hypothetical protein BAUCODRAFT_145542 [Baudoinia panamericana UAMH 10762]